MFNSAEEVINKGYTWIVIHDIPFNIISGEGNKLKLLNPFNEKMLMNIQVECIDGKNIIAQ